MIGFGPGIAGTGCAFAMPPSSLARCNGDNSVAAASNGARLLRWRHGHRFGITENGDEPGEPPGGRTMHALRKRDPPEVRRVARYRSHMGGAVHVDVHRRKIDGVPPA